jgi:DNA-binding HxlR family transcriptional regulator
MTSIKTTSTRNGNKQMAVLACPVSYVMQKIGGHWKPIILFQMRKGPKRYSELKRAIPAITEKMLIQHLKELQSDRLITRKVVQIMPPVVTYALSSSGEALTPVLNAMAKWAIEDYRRQVAVSACG